MSPFLHSLSRIAIANIITEKKKRLNNLTTQQMELIKSSAQATAPPAEIFRGEIKLLSYLGMSKEEQYYFYGMVAASIGFYGRETRKLYLLKLYSKETDPCLKEIIGGRYPFRYAELKGADAYVKRYGRNPKYYFLFPLAFLTYEGLNFSLRGLITDR